MPLKFRFKSKDEIPTEHLPFYAERDGGWMLDVDVVVDPAFVEELRRASKSKLDEFRNNNLTLIKERDELKQRFEGIDPEEVRKLADEKRRLEEAQQIKAGEVEKVIETRIKTVKGDYEKQLSAATTERDALNARGQDESPALADHRGVVDLPRRPDLANGTSALGHRERRLQRTHPVLSPGTLSEA